MFILYQGLDVIFNIWSCKTIQYSTLSGIKDTKYKISTMLKFELYNG
jgi:hypothetical protein